MLLLDSYFACGPLCSNVSYDASSRFASFQTTHLAPLALLVSRTRLLPYSAWHVRPTGGRNGNSAAITLDLPGLGERVVLEVGKGTAALTEPTTWPQLESLVGVAMAPLDLLQVSRGQRGAGACRRPTTRREAPSLPWKRLLARLVLGEAFWGV